MLSIAFYEIKLNKSIVEYKWIVFLIKNCPTNNERISDHNAFFHTHFIQTGIIGFFFGFILAILIILNKDNSQVTY